MITFAKLNEQDLLPVTQVLWNLAQGLIVTSKVFSFAPALCSGDLKLLELPPDLANSLSKGEILTLRFGNKSRVFKSKSVQFSSSNWCYILPHKVLNAQR